MTDDSGLVDIKSIIKNTLQKFDAGSQRKAAALPPAAGLWRKAVGEKISRHTRPGSIHRGCLTVYVSSAVWMQELQFMKKHILESINALRAEDEPIRDIRFKPGHMPDAVPAAPGRAHLTEQELAFVQASSVPIKDPELRSSFESLISAHLKRTKK